jgi:hypothetical protein
MRHVMPPRFVTTCAQRNGPSGAEGRLVMPSYLSVPIGDRHDSIKRNAKNRSVLRIQIAYLWVDGSPPAALSTP